MRHDSDDGAEAGQSSSAAGASANIGRKPVLARRSLLRGVGMTGAGVAAVGLSLPATPATAEPAPRPNRPESESATRWSAELDEALAELVAMPGGPPGAVAVVQIGDHRTFRSAGVADVVTRAQPSIHHRMRIASVSKAFSGAVALSLVDKKKLSLTDTIGGLLPALPTAWAKVTLRQLLNHTSGLPDITASSEFIQAVMASPDKAPPPERLLPLLARLPLAFSPGTRYAYSNSDNFAVALMIQAVTGRSYTTVLAERVLRPLKLTQTQLPAGVDIARPTLRGYDFSDDGTLEDVTAALAAGWAWSSGGVVSTPADLNTFIRAYVAGDLYGARTKAEQQRLFIPGAESSPPGPGHNSASLALFRYETPSGTMYGHTGNTFGYTQFAAASPNGRRSATVAMTLQRSSTSSGQALSVFHALQRTEEAAMRLALRKR